MDPFQDDLFDVFDSKKRKEEPQQIQPKKFPKLDEPEPEKEEPNVEVTVSTSFLVSREACNHQVALPPNYQGEDPLTMKANVIKPAKTYPYVLDAFQREAVNALENKQSVLVSAHTSAGKTTVAEYAISMCLRDGSRCVYTSPIKALSNQKYRDFNEEYKDVGLMTGDVTISPNASCIVMTTEILRSMLYRGSTLLNEVAWVIFDEVHYMRDKERGVVWEETIILLPNSVRYVFLSATIPNALEFAEWIAKLKGQPVHVVYTDYRPTPLQQYIFPENGDGIHLVIDEKGKFREDNYQKAVSTLKTQKPVKGQQSDIYKIVKMIIDRNYQPAIVFSFSKKECEQYALQMSKLDFNTQDEKALIQEVFTNAIDSLSDDDKKLPQVEHILPLLKRGIGIHHSGLLPVIKEVIELLFQEGLCKTLFSTETFSLGLNMPARTVVFTSLQKFDGQEFRMVSGGEYIQMSGRAGRRGIDDRGIVIMMLTEKDNFSEVKKLFMGKSDPLNSSFRLSYYTILNLLRVEEITPEYIMERSFLQHQTQRIVPELESRVETLKKQLETIQVANEEKFAVYQEIKSEMESSQLAIIKETTKPTYCLPFMQPGRLVHVKDEDVDWGWGIVINFMKKKTASSDPSAKDYTIDVLLNYTPLQKGVKAVPQPKQDGEMVVVPVLMDTICEISTVKVVLPKSLKTPESRAQMSLKMHEILNRFNDKIPVLDPIKDMGIKDKSIGQNIKNVATAQAKLKSMGFKFDATNWNKFQEKNKIREQITKIEANLKNSGKLVFKEDLAKMMRVLRRLECTNKDNVIQTKGRVACEINSADELILTEMMFLGVFNDLTPEQCGAVLSCLIFTESSREKDTKVKLSEDLQKPYMILLENARKVARVSIECKISLNEEDYVSSLSPALMQVVYAWMKGHKFSEICKMTDIYEGSIVRAIRRLEELMRQMACASKAIGDENLEKKFTIAMQKMKRDIVFSNSLYI